MVALVVARDVDVDDVTILELAVVRNAVADHLRSGGGGRVEREAARKGKGQGSRGQGWQMY